MVRCAEAESEHVNRPEIELDECSLPQSRKHALGEFEMIEAEPADV
jgi:hypothetical protein